MGRPTVVSDERILEAAREAFLEQGIAATTAEVARRAGVAEGTLFKRFTTKADLFKAAMQFELDEPAFLRTLIGAREEDDPRDVLYEVGVQALTFFRRFMPLMMMQWSSGKHFGIPPHLLGPSSPPLQALRAVSAFVEREIRAGRIRQHDPEVVARMLLGSIQSYVFFEILLRSQAKMPQPLDQYLRSLINILWTGVGPTPSKRGH